VTPLPEGFGLALDRSVHVYGHGAVLVGGHPGRLMTLSQGGVSALERLRAGPASSGATRRLAGRLVEAGVAHPRWFGADRTGRSSLTVVVPTRDRTPLLDRCLGALRSALGREVPVVVVDDASADAKAVAACCRRHHAVLLRLEVNGGPAAARNHALRHIDTELIAFVDSDCTVTPGWLSSLLPLFDDPTIGAVAPRVRPPLPPEPSSVVTRYAFSRSPLDLGTEPSEVGAGRRVRYVPTAALVVRRTAISDGFDPDLRVGEDVDLVWRLLAAGWRVRFEPSAIVEHHEPGSWTALLARRRRYGLSAGPLSRRHPGCISSVDLRPWPAAAVAAALIGAPCSALGIAAAGTASAVIRVRGHGVPVTQSVRSTMAGVGWTLLGMGKAATMLGGPLVVAAGLRSRKAALRSVVLVLVPPLYEWWCLRPRLDPIRWTVGVVMDDLSYGAGVWAGCMKSRSLGPLLPVIVRPSRRRTTERKREERCR